MPEGSTISAGRLRTASVDSFGDITLTVGTNTIEMTGITNSITPDSETQEAYKGLIGMNTISRSGTSVIVQPD